MNARETLEKELTELGEQAEAHEDMKLRGRIDAIIGDLSLPAGKEYAYKVLPEIRRAVKRLVGPRSETRLRSIEPAPGADIDDIVA